MEAKIQGELSSTNRSDPLQEVYGKPMVGMEMPGNRYLGRVVVELYESTDAFQSDDMNIVYSVDPAHGANIEAKALVKRVADALHARIARNSK